MPPFPCAWGGALGARVAGRWGAAAGGLRPRRARERGRAPRPPAPPPPRAGGFKLWEGGVDLAAYVAALHGLTPAALAAAAHPPATGLEARARACRSPPARPPAPATPRARRAAAAADGAPPPPPPPQSLRVLELGCGHGLPGVAALLGGAEVHFQDFNAEVLSALTAPNVAANLARLPRGALRPEPRFFAGACARAEGAAARPRAAASPLPRRARAPRPRPPPPRAPSPPPAAAPGDWLAVGRLLSAEGLGAYYDLVLSAETIYSAAGAGRLLKQSA